MLSLAVMAVVMSLIWELRAFCRYVCPMASFISAYASVGRLMVRDRDAQTCRECTDKSCLRGNAEGWACPYGLLLPSLPIIHQTSECGACTECFKSKPIGNPVGETKPWITHLETVDLDGDGFMDVVVCDAKLNQIRWIQQNPKGYSKKLGSARGFELPLTSPLRTSTSMETSTFLWPKWG